MSEEQIKNPPKGLMILAMVGPAFVWCAEYIGSGEVVLATRTGAILSTTVLWSVIFGIFLKYWIGMSGARYTVCTGEAMMDMFGRIPGPKNWVVWLVFAVQFLAAIIAIAALANVAGVFLAGFIGHESRTVQILCGWGVSLFAGLVVWSGKFDALKMVMSVFIFIVVVGVLYVAVRVFPSMSELARAFIPNVPEVPQWAVAKGVGTNAWKEILPLIGWGAGGFASQVWYTYWVLGAGYGMAAGRGDGRAADVVMLKKMDSATARKVKGWCHVLYTDATIAMIIGVVVTSSFVIAGSGILRPRELAPDGARVAIMLSEIFGTNWGKAGAFLFLLSGTAALISTQIGQLAGWPRLLADCCRICFPAISNKYPWKTRYRFFLVMFFFTSMVIIYTLGFQPVMLVKIAAICDGLLLTPLQAVCIAIGLFFIMPRLLSADAHRILRPSWFFIVGLAAAFFVFTYFCVFQIPAVVFQK